jgi:hypothetical protein
MQCIPAEGDSEIIVPDGVIGFGKHVFDNCESIKRIVIPSSVNFIGQKMIWLPSIEEVVILGKYQDIHEEAFPYNAHKLRIVMGTEDLSRFTELRSLFERLISEKLTDVRINTPACRYAPHIISITLPSIRSETMLHFLSSRGVYVSSGSACASNTGHKSHVLLSFGLPDKEVDSTIRVSLGVQTTEEDINNLVNALEEGIASLSRKTR